MTKYEILSLVIQTLTSALIGGTLLYTGYQIRQHSRIHRENHDWNRRFAAQEALRHCNDNEINRSLNEKFSHSTRGERIPLEEIKQHIEKDPGIVSEIHHLLNMYESLARGINQGIYDEQVIKNGRRGAMTKMIDFYWPYIEHRRRIRGAPDSWIEYEKLVNKWKAEDSPLDQRSITGK